jgi:hypothetical protein
LKSITKYNSSRYDPRKLNPNTKILFEGNSVLAEIMNMIICETDPPYLYRFDYNSTNSVFAYYPKNHAMILGIDNDYDWQRKPDDIIHTIYKSEFHPMYIVLGNINVKAIDDHGSSIDRFALYHQMWPEAIIIPMFHTHLHDDCKAEFHNCEVGRGHQCFPGPLVRTAEKVMQHIIDEDEFLSPTLCENAHYKKYYYQYIPTE